MIASQTEELADQNLVAAVRGGDPAAFALLWERHLRSARGYASSLRAIADPDDLVAEAFLRVYIATRAGGGPGGEFRDYLLTTMKNIALNWKRAATREIETMDFETYPGGVSAEAEALRQMEHATTARAFESLPSQMRTALWHSEVERLPRNEIAKRMGLTPNAVSQLTFRARDALRTAWLTEHISLHHPRPGCEAVAELVAGYARGALSTRDTARVDAHVSHCVSCPVILEEANHLAEAIALTQAAAPRSWTTKTRGALAKAALKPAASSRQRVPA